MVLCQNSMHAALQLFFLFSAALEDYQPESKSGQHNPECNPFYFKRCARLLQDLERAVIYGSQTLSNKEERILKRRLTNPNMQNMDAKTLEAELVEAKKLEIANSLAKTQSAENYDGMVSGVLLYKRLERKSMFASKPWKKRHFVVDQRVLLCFREPHSVNPLRALPLAPCHVEVVDHDPKYGETRFDLVNYSNNLRYPLRAEDAQERDKWVSLLRRYKGGTMIEIMVVCWKKSRIRFDFISLTSIFFFF